MFSCLAHRGHSNAIFVRAFFTHHKSQVSQRTLTPPSSVPSELLFAIWWLELSPLPASVLLLFPPQAVLVMRALTAACLPQPGLGLTSQKPRTRASVCCTTPRSTRHFTILSMYSFLFFSVTWVLAPPDFNSLSVTLCGNRKIVMLVNSADLAVTHINSRRMNYLQKVFFTWVQHYNLLNSFSFPGSY